MLQMEISTLRYCVNLLRHNLWNLIIHYKLKFGVQELMISDLIWYWSVRTV